jgi:hypothetical protein
MVLKFANACLVTALVIFVWGLCALGVKAQVTTADVVGTVTDTTGGVLPGATVTITNTGTSVSQSTSSTSTGDYVFNLLQVGNYSVKVEAKGFKTFVAPSLNLSSGDRARVDAKLEIGDVNQTVEVSGTVAPALQTDSATVGGLVTSQAVEDVPLNGRNIVMLVQLAPGVNQGSPNDLMSGTRPDDRRSTTAYSANGQTDSVNQNMVDGMDNQDPIIATTLIRPSIDAIQEVNVSTSIYDASATRSAGAVVDIITKSGSNDFHGSAYEFFRNRVLNTNPNHAFPSGYSSTGTLLLTPVLTKPAFRQNQYGGSIGGPIKKDKTFFFFDLEKLSKANGLQLLSTVPTLCEWGKAACPDGRTQFGDFSDQPDLSAYGGGSSNCTPNTFTVAVGSCPYSVVPLGNVTPLGFEYFDMFPLPNVANSIQNNYASNPTYTQSGITYDIRIDHHFNDSNTLFARYSYNDVTTITPGAFPIKTISQADANAVGLNNLAIPTVTVNPGAAPYAGQNNFPGPSLVRAQGILISYVHVFNPNLVLNLKAGYSRLGDNVYQLNKGTGAGTKLGFPCGVSICSNFNGNAASGVPEAAFPAPQATSSAGYTDIGDSYAIPILYIDNIFQYNANLTWNKGTHSVRYGIALIRRREAQGQSFDPTGLFEFTGGYTGTLGGDLLEGESATVMRNYAVVVPNERQWQPGVFFQDDWRATHWLTLNLGARYDIFSPLTEKYGRISNFQPGTGLMGSPALPGANQTGPTAGILTDYKDWAPRIGFAASLKHDMVLRGGFGISYFQNRAAIFRNAPFGYTYTCNPQNAAQSNATCAAQATGGNSAVVHFGAPAGANSTTNNGTTSPAYVGAGGGLFADGVPIPSVNATPVLPPSTCPITDRGMNPLPSGCLAYNPITNPNSANLYSTITTSSTWPKQPIPYLEQFSLQLQKAFKENVIQIGYVGELGRHNGGTIPFSTINNINVTSNPLTATYPWLNANTVSSTAAINTTSYHSLQVNLVRRFSNGLTVNINYAWAHALQSGQEVCRPVYSPADFGYGTGPKFINPCYYDNVKNPSSPIAVTSLRDGPGFIGNTQYDIPNHIAGTINYLLPFGKNLKGIEGGIIKGWAANASGYWQSGLDFNVTNGAALGSGTMGGLDQVCSGKLANASLQQWINPACFVQPTYGTFGTEDQAQWFGPRQRNLDFSLFKEFGITERIRMQFRAEVFNLLNVVNYAQPGGASGNGLGSITIPAFSIVNTTGTCGGTNSKSTCGPGVAQATPTALKTGAIGALNPNSNSRQIQFGLKFLF